MNLLLVWEFVEADAISDFYTLGLKSELNHDGVEIASVEHCKKADGWNWHNYITNQNGYSKTADDGKSAAEKSVREAFGDSATFETMEEVR